MLWTGLAAPPLAGAATVGEFEVSATLEFGGPLVSERWTPVRIQLTNPTDADVDGHVSLPVNDGTAAFVVRQRCHVPAHSRARLTVYGRFAEPARGAAGAAPVLSRVEWTSAAGKRLAVTDLIGTAGAKVTDAPADGAAGGSALLLVIGDRDQDIATADAADPYDATVLAQSLSAASHRAVATAWVAPAVAPRHRAGLDGCLAVVLDATNPDDLDVAQRRALLDYVTTGGTVIVAAPTPSGATTPRWIDPLLPVGLVGEREAAALQPTVAPATAPIARSRTPGHIGFRTNTLLTEAVASDGHVVLQDAHYVHAAYRPLGLGRMAFTSFPTGALDPADPAATALWAKLFGLEGRDRAWESSRLTADAPRVLEEMAGFAAAPWRLAAGVVVGYLLLATIVQMSFTGTRRPTGLVVLLALSVVGAAVIAAGAARRQTGAALSGARLAVIDLAPGGGGVHREVAAWLGADAPDLSIRTEVPGGIVRPIATDPQRPPVVESDPFDAPGAGGRPATVERVWHASRPIDASTRLSVRGTFGPDGLLLSTDNQIGHPVRAPLLLWTDTMTTFRLADLDGGASDAVRPGGRSRRGDFTNTGTTTSESARLRAAILQSASTTTVPGERAAGDAAAPLLCGWLDEGALPSVLSFSQVPNLRTQALVRVPVEIQSSAPGSRVRVDGAFVRLVAGPGAPPPFDPWRQEWIPTAVGGQWVVGFVPPREVGSLRPLRVRLTCHASAPQQTIRLLGGQVANGVTSANGAGREVARWSNPIEPREVAFTPESDDRDANGHVWLMVRVEAGSPDGEATSPWSFERFELTYEEAEVLGPWTTNPDAARREWEASWQDPQ